jgi:hypothetical protein
MANLQALRRLALCCGQKHRQETRADARIDSVCREQLVQLSTAEPDSGNDARLDSAEATNHVLALIKSSPGNVSLASMLTEIEKLRSVRSFRLPSNVFEGVAPRMVSKWCAQALIESPSHLRRHREELTVVLLAALVARRGGAMGCVGYCIGARSALCTIRDRGDIFRAAAGLHPSFCTTDDADSPHLAVPSYTGSLYIGFGSEDKSQPASANMPLIDFTNALENGEAEIHDGANHGYSVFGPAYHGAAADRSYARIEVMFDRKLTA